jgi:hypothetical protein
VGGSIEPDKKTDTAPVFPVAMMIAIIDVLPWGVVTVVRTSGMTALVVVMTMSPVVSVIVTTPVVTVPLIRMRVRDT